MVHNIHKIIQILRAVSLEWCKPIVTEIASVNRDPFKVLISTVISLRTKDDVTREASERLYKLAVTPEEMLKLSRKKIEKAIYPAGFYRNKAKTILDISKLIIDKYNGKVPAND